MRSLRYSALAFLAGSVLACAPAEEDKAPPPPPTATENGDDAETSADTTDETGGTDTGGAENCGELICNGHGSCVEDEEEGPSCVCDEHYVLDPNDDTNCIVDETCIELRFLEDNCRQLVNDAPAVSLFFAVDFCSGDAVLPEKLDELGLEFKVLEDDNDIEDNPESSAAVIDKDVESFVTLVVDVSDSITESEDLPALIDALQAFVAKLEPGQNEARVSVEIIVFGREVGLYEPLTSDFAALNTALENLADQGVVTTMGTSLYDAVEAGINSATRARALRSGVTNDGVLSTGTVVVVTDGKESSGGKTLNKSLINGTLNQVISVGISEDIDGEDLDDIGRDGSFLAPTPDDWAEAFDEIAVRVDQYPDRAYLLAYCSSTSQGSPTVTISLDGIEPEEEATCKFDADLFASMPPVCDQTLFATECDDKACGGWLTGCGGCSDSQCCAGTVCGAPDDASDCNEQDALCNVSDQVCIPDADVEDLELCTPPPAIGEDCINISGNNYTCHPGISYCQTDDQLPEHLKCLPAIQAGELCEKGKGYQCETLRCAQLKPENMNDPYICMPSAKMFDKCSSGEATCENGTYCSGDCTERKKDGVSCGKHEECRSGICDGDPKRCLGSLTCYWAWDEVSG